MKADSGSVQNLLKRLYTPDQSLIQAPSAARVALNVEKVPISGHNSHIQPRVPVCYIPAQFEPSPDQVSKYGQQSFHCVRELHLRLTEQLQIDQELEFQKAHYQNLMPVYQAPFVMPIDSYPALNPIIRPELPINQTSQAGFLQQFRLMHEERVSALLFQNEQRRQLINRLVLLKSQLQDHFCPSQITQIEESRRKRTKNIDGFGQTAHLSNFSLEQVNQVLVNTFKAQNQSNTSAQFGKTLWRMSHYYLQVFNKIALTEQDLKTSPDFERTFYEKVHQKYPHELVKQPQGLKGVNLKPYQMDGLRFLVSMYLGNAQGKEPAVGKNVCGVCVADDMGLGKTLQSISLMQYLVEKKIQKNMHLIVAPLAVSDNWIREFKKFAPDLNIISYKGADREKARREITTKKNYYTAVITTYDYAMSDRAFFRKIPFDMVIVDEASRIKNCRSKLIGVLRNDIQCKFRLLLSGTPLQNNIRELFTLLQFIHGSVFQNFDTFDQIFGKIVTTVQFGESDDEDKGSEDEPVPDELKESDLESEFNATNASEVRASDDVTPSGIEATEQLECESSTLTQSTTAGHHSDKMTDAEKVFIIHRLHGIIKPFMIRRVKSDVLDQLPPKEEIILRCPLSGLQQHLYSLAIQQAGRILDNQYTETKQNLSALPKYFIRNVDMYLRKICNHPYAGLESQQLKHLYYYLLNESQQFMESHQQANSKLYQKQLQLSQQVVKEEKPVDQAVVDPNKPEPPSYIQNLYLSNAMWRNSGKLELLHRILLKMKQTNHRVLIFSQFKSILNILEQFCLEREYKYLRFDGDVKDTERNKMVGDFSKEDSQYFIFLLSTRAAAHGLNLQSADTVIIYDCDFNAFYDLQAQDRVYRIGQTKSVKVFKFYTNTTLEQKMLNAAQGKLQMASTIIDAGGFSQNSKEEQRKTTKEIILDVFKSGQILQQDVHILQGAELNKALSRSDAEFRIFENMDQKSAKEWSEFNLQKEVPQIEQKIPEIFLEEQGNILESLKEKYLAAEQYEEQIPKKDGRGRKKKVKVEELETQPETATEQEGEEAEEEELLRLTSIQQWVNKDLYYTLFNELQNQDIIPNVYSFVQNVEIKPAAQRYSNLFKLSFQYMAQEVIDQFVSSYQFENLNALELFSGPGINFEGTFNSLSFYLKNSSELADYGFKFIKSDRTPIKVFYNTKIHQQLCEKCETALIPELFKSQIAFASRILSILHELCRFSLKDVDYTADGSISGKNHLEYHPMYQFWSLPTVEQLPDYYTIVSTPIPFKLIHFKAITLSYTSLGQFVSDVRLVFSNCRLYNPKTSFLRNFAKLLEDEFEKLLTSFFDEEDVKKNDSTIGFGLLDVLTLQDQLVSKLNFKEITPSDEFGVFGTGHFGGGFYEMFTFEITKHISNAMKKKKAKQ
ncbi:SNF2_family helicase [Hexamita inflata]|uniref:SNF2_family helicase n=1 Tax=Hexamita inflata TaxID=28002 RepID=A0ABP1H6Q2_9EUKA